MTSDKTPSEILIRPQAVLRQRGDVQVSGDPADGLITLRNNSGADGGSAEVVLDYGRCEGGTPIFHIQKVESPSGHGNEKVTFEVTYSETVDGFDHETGDGPFFLFSSCMDSYRHSVYELEPNSSNEAQVIEARFVQASQRYQKMSLKNSSPGSSYSVTFCGIGFRPSRPVAPQNCTFISSDPALNQIWSDGVRTVDMCTVSSGQVQPAWDFTEEGTRVLGGHWAPCRLGTRWADKTVTFETRIEKGGASWGVHMVANGLIFVLDAQSRVLSAHVGLAHVSSIFPSMKKDSWELPSDLDLSQWMHVSIEARGGTVSVEIQGKPVASVNDLELRPLLGGSGINTGSVAFGGPAGFAALFRSLVVKNPSNGGITLYENDLSAAEAARTSADFQVGTNALACTIDGAKRDRACFGGDLLVMGPSLAYSTRTMDAWAGSIKLLMSHQTSDGYLGNLCTIQAPEHTPLGAEGKTPEPPTYAFYSLTYALLLVASVYDYWLQSGDYELVEQYLGRMARQIEFTERMVNKEGLVEAPPPLSMNWFPQGGPIFGVSSGINLAYIGALHAMARMSPEGDAKSAYLFRAGRVKQGLLRTLWSEESGILRMHPAAPNDGYCQDVNGYAVLTGVTPVKHPAVAKNLSSSDDPLPLAFKGLGKWDDFKVVSPFASGFAVEALLALGEAEKALDLLHRVWGFMADSKGPNYSGAQWEALNIEGKPPMHDSSLVHGWSSWPVSLLPKYLAGLRPIEAGWKKFGVEPVLAGPDSIECSIKTPPGLIKVKIEGVEGKNLVTLTLFVPKGATAVVKAPQGWKLDGPSLLEGNDQDVQLRMQKL